MYYGGKIFAIKYMYVEKIYLYNQGDQCTDVTGGWTLGNGNFGATFITLNSSGNNFIQTINNIRLEAGDRLYMRLKTTASQSNWTVGCYVGQTTNPNLLRNSLDGATLMSQASYSPPNVEKTFYYFKNDLSPLGLLKWRCNFGTYYIYEIWIEKYT